MPKNVAPREFLGPRQMMALRVLAGGGSTAEAATAAGVNVRTAERWMTQQEFKKALRRMQTDVLGSIASRLVALAKTSVETLHELLEDTKTSHALRARVAIAALDAAMKWHEATAIEERLTAVEEILLRTNVRRVL